MKTSKEIKTMITAIESELYRLPEINTFGDLNRESRQEMQNDLLALQYTLGNPTAKIKNDEVRNWLNGKFSILEDYTT